MCIRANDRRPDRLPFSLYVPSSIFSQIFFKHMDAAGLSGGAPVAIGSGSVGDLFSERDRASAMAMYNLGTVIGT